MSLKINQTAKTHNGTTINRVRFDNVQVGDRLVHIPSGELGTVVAVEGVRGTNGRTIILDAEVATASGKTDRLTYRGWGGKSLWKVAG